MKGFAAIINPELDGGHMLGYMTKWTNCKSGSYAAMGSFSFMSNTTIGSYCTFGSRVSIGAFSHPIDWLSIHEFQYRDTSKIYGSSILDDDINKLKSDDNKLTEIGSDVWFGDNSVIRRGVQIGTGAIIGNSISITSNVPPYAIVAGNPGKIINKGSIMILYLDCLDQSGERGI